MVDLRAVWEADCLGLGDGGGMGLLGIGKHQGNPLFLTCSPGRRVVALPRGGKGGLEAGTAAQGAVCCLNGGACQAAGIQGLHGRCRTLRRMAANGRRSRRSGLGGGKKRVSRSRPDTAAERSGPEECGVSAGARNVEGWTWTVWVA